MLAKTILRATPLILGLWPLACLAGDLATGGQIKAALAGNTVRGSMQASGDYAEFYGADGAVKAKDYTGSWRIKGDQMCLTYGQDPETCWGVRLDGASVVWVGRGGDEGAGAIQKGNPNGF